MCNSCGDLFTEGKLQYSDLKAPGAMKAFIAANQDITGEDVVPSQVEEKNGDIPVKVEEGHTAKELVDDTAVNSEEQKETSTQVVQAERPPEQPTQLPAIESQTATQSLPETTESRVDMQDHKVYKHG